MVEGFDLLNAVGGGLGMFLGMSLFSILVGVQKSIDRKCKERRHHQGIIGINTVKPVDIDLPNMDPSLRKNDAPPVFRFTTRL